VSVRTWHIESAVVLAVLSITALIAGGEPVQWLGVLAVWLSFGHASIAERMREREALREKPAVHCHRWSSACFVGKELAWVALFLATHAYAAVVGCALFLLYPLWRRAWRHVHPITA
jgi:phosphatidylglycerophosphate synthase